MVRVVECLGARDVVAEIVSERAGAFRSVNAYRVSDAGASAGKIR